MSSQVAERTGVEEFGAFAGELKTEDGAPLHIYPFQETCLAPYFDGVRSTVILLPKKNGKTTLIAALALYHLLVTPNAECIMVAASREQAEIILRQARMFVRQSESLRRVMTIQQRTILSKLDEGRIRVLASDVDTADGALPTLAIVDELHRHKSLDLYGVMQDGLGPRGGQIITISTAGASFDSPLGQVRTNAHAMPGFTREGTYNHVREPGFAFHEWCLDSDADVDDLKVVKTANPAPWQSIEALAERKADPSMTPWRWLRFACGVWTEGEEPWIAPHVWDGLVGTPPQVGETVWVGVDTGIRDEERAVVVLGQHGDTLTAKARILPASADMEAIEDEVRAVARDYRVISVTFEPRQFRSAELLEKEGLMMVEFPMTQERMSKASTQLWRLIERREFAHDGGATFRAHVMGGVVKEDGRGWRIQRDPRTRQPVAALMALLMAVQAASDQPVQEAVLAWA